MPKTLRALNNENKNDSAIMQVTQNQMNDCTSREIGWEECPRNDLWGAPIKTVP